MSKKLPAFCRGCDTVVDFVAYRCPRGVGYCVKCMVDAPVASVAHALGLPSSTELLYRPGDRVHAAIAGICVDGIGTVVDLRFHLDGVGGDRVIYRVALDEPTDDPLTDGWYSPRDLWPAVDDLDAEFAALTSGTP